MAHEAQSGFLAGSLAIEPRVRIGRRGMSLVRASLAPEVGIRIAPASGCGRLVRAILESKALYRGPGLDQGAVDREVLGGEQPLDPGLSQHCGKELGCDVTLEQPVAV